MSLLDDVHGPADLKRLTPAQLPLLAAELRDVVPGEVVEAALAAYEREGRRLLTTGRQVALVDAALRGERHVPRL